MPVGLKVLKCQLGWLRVKLLKCQLGWLRNAFCEPVSPCTCMNEERSHLQRIPSKAISKVFHFRTTVIDFYVHTRTQIIAPFPNEYPDSGFVWEEPGGCGRERECVWVRARACVCNLYYKDIKGQRDPHTTHTRFNTNLP
jgi:hypothetical protein